MKEEPTLSDQSGIRKRDGHELTYKYLIAASLAALMISTFASWFFYSRWNEAEDRYTAQLTEVSQLSQTYSLMKSTLEVAMTDLAHLRDENAECYQLYPVDSSLHVNVRVYSNKYSGQTYVDVILIPNPLPGTVYHLWSRYLKEEPIDCGILEHSSITTQLMRNTTNVSAWLVTLEQTGITPDKPSFTFVAKTQNW